MIEKMVITENHPKTMNVSAAKPTAKKFFLRSSRMTANAQRIAISKNTIDKNILTPPPYVEDSAPRFVTLIINGVEKHVSLKL